MQRYFDISDSSWSSNTLWFIRQMKIIAQLQFHAKAAVETLSYLRTFCLSCKFRASEPEIFPPTNKANVSPQFTVWWLSWMTSTTSLVNTTSSPHWILRLQVDTGAKEVEWGPRSYHRHRGWTYLLVLRCSHDSLGGERGLNNGDKHDTTSGFHSLLEKDIF